VVFSQVRLELVGTYWRKTRFDVVRPSTIKSSARSFGEPSARSFGAHRGARVNL